MDKAILAGKEKRKPYRGGKAIDRTCRNHQGCPACENNRKHSARQREMAAEDKIRDFLNDL